MARLPHKGFARALATMAAAALVWSLATPRALADPQPIADAGADQSVEEQARVTLNGAASFTPYDGPLSFTWSQIAGPPAPLSDPHAPAPHFTAPEVHQNTLLRFALVVEDQGQISTPDEVSVEIKHVNKPPTARATGPQRVQEGQAFTLDGRQSQDPDALDTLRFRWAQTDGPAVELLDSAASTLQLRAPGVDRDSQLRFTLYVSDDAGDTSQADVLIDVSPDQQPPQAQIQAPARVHSGQSVLLDGAMSQDPHGAALRWRWEQAQGPAVELQGQHRPQAHFVAPQVRAPAVLVFALTVSSDLDSEPAWVEVHVDPDPEATWEDSIEVLGSAQQAQAAQPLSLRANRPPEVATAHSQVVRPGARVTLRADGFDPDGDTLRWSWRQRRGPSVQWEQRQSHQASLLIPEDTPASLLLFEVTAHDGALRSEPALTALVVQRPRSSPGISSEPWQEPTEPQARRGCSALPSPGSPRGAWPLLLLGAWLLLRRRRPLH